MIFSSTTFLFLFLPLILLVYYFLLTQGIGIAQTVVLLIASLALYAWGEPYGFLVLVISITVNFFTGRQLGGERSKGKKRFPRLVFGIVFNLAILCFYKFFAISSVNVILSGQAPQASGYLPIGITFFTFQSLSYLVDVYRGKAPPQRNPLLLALYISLFPVLVAGPLVRYKTILRQIRHREHSFEKFAAGAQRFIIGLAKKILIANTVGQFADMAFLRNELSAPMAWVGVLAFAIQFHFDFSGYSDMAIGLGRMFGFSLPENFNYPYISSSLTKFWRRWNISLWLWLRDYLYLPLGGGDGRRGYRNLFILFLAMGLWYGAGWPFIVWGLYHGFFLALERAILGKVLRNLPRFVGWIYTMLVVLVGWVLFRAGSLPQAFHYLKGMAAFSGGGLTTVLVETDPEFLIAFVLGLIGCTPILPWLKRVFLGGRNPMSGALTGVTARAGAFVSTVCCIFLLVLSIVYLTGSSFNPFRYF